MAALEPYGIEEHAIPTAFNLFMNVPVGSEGKIRVLPPTTKAGDFIRLRALDDLIVGLTAAAILMGWRLSRSSKRIGQSTLA